MDVFGAFQLCSIGILAAPVTVRLSQTYFNVTGRNLIFLWTGLILAGLLSLTVEFFRSDASDCQHDESGRPISPNPKRFQYNTNCGLRCTVELGPHSPLRGGSANNIYVIPTPDKLTFGTATLLAAACCIPAILSIISMWKEILEINWETRFGKAKDDRSQEPIAGTNGATIEKMRAITGRISLFLWAVQIPLIGAAVLAILVIGERNFFSAQVSHQTEPIASIGQWAPIAGTILAVLGSLYVLLDKMLEGSKGDMTTKPCTKRCTCSAQGSSQGLLRVPSQNTVPAGATALQDSLSDGQPNNSMDKELASSAFASDQDPQNDPPPRTDAGSRRKVADALASIARYMGTPAHYRFDDSQFKNGVAGDYPWIPAEPERNINYWGIEKHCNQGREGEGSVSPMLRARSSRAGSLTGSVASGVGLKAGSMGSPQSPNSLLPSSSSNPSADATTQRVRSQTGRTMSEPEARSGSPCPPSLVTRFQERPATLQIPPRVYHSPTRENRSLPEGQASPTIVISPSSDGPAAGDATFGEPPLPP
ncbi:hypothetical protein A1O1_04052 [Capronia coronata CBS 617.96]|uniref:Transmembrane protein n=1 Tax=Capronia coronata CBS 617.96 TaxID=1182541 RepID=W9YMQ5_9EURO|nr:uncharacterized protein A1O1_04052 [Capronia coronata CBS 617.96]EXJ90945.1 hypothetical protein A1O1_04052 [Capronia coronata CBS 617.96]